MAMTSERKNGEPVRLANTENCNRLKNSSTQIALKLKLEQFPSSQHNPRAKT